MKRRIISLVSAFSLAALTMNAQTPGTATTTTEKPVSIQIRAGVNFANLTGEFDGDDFDAKIKPGFHAGIEIPIMIAPDFYIQPGVLYSLKGAKSKNDDDTKIHLGYVEIPVNFVYKPLLGAGHLILGVGPYMGIGVNGKIKSGDEEADIEFEKDATVAQALTGRYFKRTDFGGNLLAGYEFSNKLFFQLNAQLGLTSISSKISGVDEDDYNLKNTGFGVSVGYRF